MTTISVNKERGVIIMEGQKGYGDISTKYIIDQGINFWVHGGHGKGYKEKRRKVFLLRLALVWMMS